MSAGQRYPLVWPTGQPRTRHRLQARFEVDFGRARDELLHSLELLGALNVILSSNVPLRRDGLPLSGTAEPIDPGIAVYFDRRIPDGKRAFVIACDTYVKVKWNVRALGATVEALRSIQRHGATSLLEQAFSGFAALPPAIAPRPWWIVLGVSANATGVEVRAAYRELAGIHHPDKGGDDTRMQDINNAFDEFKRACPERQ